MLHHDIEFLRADLTIQHGNISSLQRNVGFVQSDVTSLRSDFSLFSSTSPTPHRSLVEPSVISDLRFSGDAKSIDSFLITIYDIMEANAQCFVPDSCKISCFARHFSPGSPALDWWVSQLQENARAYTRDHPDAPCLAGAYLVAGVPFTIPVLLDVSLFLRTLARIISDPDASQTALQEFQSLTMGKLSVIQFNA